MPIPAKFLRFRGRYRLYPALLAIVLAAWLSYMSASNSWSLFKAYWPMSVTMILGSFVAGATPQGGAAVAFPVFTKVLQISAAESRTFGLMIQAVGMTLAAVFILGRGIRVLPRVIAWVTLGGIPGIVLGTYILVIPNPYPRVLFTLGAAAFGVALIISRWVLRSRPLDDVPDWGRKHQLLFFVVGIVGGTLTAYTGSGVNVVTFIVLTLAFGIDERISTPTSVIIMGLNSIVGFFLHGFVSREIGVVWHYWLVAIPIVAAGAPLGAFVASRVGRDTLIRFLLLLIAAETISTALLIPFDAFMVTLTGMTLGLCALSFCGMLFYRQKRVLPVAS